MPWTLQPGQMVCDSPAARGSAVRSPHGARPAASSGAPTHRKARSSTSSPPGPGRGPTVQPPKPAPLPDTPREMLLLRRPPSAGLAPPEFMGAEWPELMPCGGKCEDSYCSNVTLEAVRGKHLSTPCRAVRVGGTTPRPPSRFSAESHLAQPEAPVTARALTYVTGRNLPHNLPTQS